jgi:hypothetical protein
MGRTLVYASYIVKPHTFSFGGRLGELRTRGSCVKLCSGPYRSNQAGETGEAGVGVSFYSFEDQFRFIFASVTGLSLDRVYQICPINRARILWARFSGKSLSDMEPL